MPDASPRTRPRRAAAAVAALAVAIPLLGAGCSGQHRTRSLASVSLSGATAYSPTVVKAFADDRLVLRVSNLTAKTHGFSIDGYGVRRTVAPGQTIHVEVKAKVGTYRVYCQLHNTHGAAQLVVSP